MSDISQQIDDFSSHPEKILAAIEYFRDRLQIVLYKITMIESVSYILIVQIDVLCELGETYLAAQVFKGFDWPEIVKVDLLLWFDGLFIYSDLVESLLNFKTCI